MDEFELYHMMLTTLRLKELVERRLELPLIAPSANRIWRTARGRTYLGPKADEFYNLVRLSLSRERPLPQTKLWAILGIQRDWVNKSDGKWKKIDLDNRIKPTLDAIGKSNCQLLDHLVSLKLVFKIHHPTERKTVIHFFHAP